MIDVEEKYQLQTSLCKWKIVYFPMTKGKTKPNVKKEHKHGLLRIFSPLPTTTTMYLRQSLLAQDARPPQHSASFLAERLRKTTCSLGHLTDSTLTNRLRGFNKNFYLPGPKLAQFPINNRLYHKFVE